LELGVAIVAVAISLVSFVVNLYASRAADRHARMPVLIPQFYEADGGGHGVSVRNIGRGPAVNVVMANALGDLAKKDIRRVRLSRYKNQRHWGGVMHLERIPEGDKLDYVWDSVGFAGALGLTYTDVLGSPYTMLSGEYGTKAINAAIIRPRSLYDLEFPQAR